MGEFAAKFRPEVDLDEFERRLRAAAPAQQQRAESSDPLAELARLVGGDAMAKRQDPFEALFRAQSAVAEIHRDALHDAPAMEDAAVAEPEHQQVAPYGLREPYLDEQASATAQAQSEEYSYQAGEFAAEPLPYQESEPAWAAEAHAVADDHAQGQDSWPEAYGGPAPASGFRRKVMLGMAAVLALGVVAIGATLAFRGKTSSDDVATIQADSDPAKVKPAQAGDSVTPAGQALFDRKGAGSVAKVVANSEQPADLGVTVKNARVVGAASGVATPTPPLPSGAAPAVPAAQPPQTDAVFPAVKKVKTIAVRADGSVLDSQDARPQVARTLPTMAMTGPAPATATPAAAAPAVPAPPARTPAAKSAERVTTTTEAALKTPARPQAANEGAGETGAFAVQLAGTPVESEARAAANALSAKYASALQGRRATFVQAQVGDKKVYRVRVGHLTEENAKSICSAIKGQGGACFVAKN